MSSTSTQEVTPSAPAGEAPSKRGRKKAEVTVLKEIIARLPPTHISPIIALVKKYCKDNKLDSCVDDNKERKELEALCKEKNIECPCINDMSLTEVKSVIRSIAKGNLKSKAMTRHTHVVAPKKVQKIIKRLEHVDREPLEETTKETVSEPTEDGTEDLIMDTSEEQTAA